MYLFTIGRSLFTISFYTLIVQARISKFCNTMYAHTVRACVYYTKVCKPIMALKREHLMEINFIMQVFKLFSHLCIKKIFSYNFSLIFLYNKNVK